jgi:hypothetical protein
LANIDKLDRLFRYMREQKIDETDWSFVDGRLLNILFCDMDGKDVTDSYDYDNHYYLDPIIDMIQRMFLDKYTDSKNRGTISVSILGDAGNKNAITITITKDMD